MIDAELLAAVYHRPLAKVAPAVEPMREALELAEAKFPRNRSDYNMEPGDAEYTVRWYAREVDGDESDSMLVTVPS